jgi:hypothetical protein
MNQVALSKADTVAFSDKGLKQMLYGLGTWSNDRR